MTKRSEVEEQLRVLEAEHAEFVQVQARVESQMQQVQGIPLDVEDAQRVVREKEFTYEQLLQQIEEEKRRIDVAQDQRVQLEVEVEALTGQVKVKTG